MPINVKFLLDFSILGQRIVLEADNGVLCNGNNDKQNLEDQFKNGLTFKGKTVGLNLNLTHVLYDLFDKLGHSAQYKEIPVDYLPDIEIRDIYVSFTNTTGNINFLALTEINGKEIQLIFQYHSASDESKSDAKYAFGIQSEISDLTGLPLVGEQMKDVKFDGLGFIYTSVAGEFKLPELSPATEGAERKMKIPDNGKTYSTGFNFTGELIYSKYENPFTLCLPLDISNGNSPQQASGKNNKSLQPGIKWINLDKKIGPLQVSKIGFSYAEYVDNTIAFYFTGSLSLSALVFSVEGLGVSFLPSKLLNGEDFKPEFTLTGLGLSFEKSPLKISGMFLRVEPTAGEELSFLGSAQLSTSKFSISGIGSYSKLSNGSDSLFIYAVYFGPIGGPSFFFVTGIAAGFGYNRKVRIPDIKEVDKFPLVATAMASDPSKSLETVLTELTSDPPWLPPSPGNYWLAVGIKFTSFKIIESFVLLTAEFGTRLEFNIIGLSILKWPGTGNTIAYVELAVLAKYVPGSDVIAVTGLLTPNSYIFDRNCKLTGGFAYYAWVSGSNEGDFVISLGGYHPRFNKPAHYPSVDRLALNWKISPELSIKGELYYALTPSLIMAGGRWELLYKTSVVKVTMVLWADMLIFWAPFQYYLDIGIIIKIEATIKVALIRIHFNFEMGAQLHIWGPPFAGEAYVDWAIYSFTIPFGDHSKKAPKPLEWHEFSNIFVPQKSVSVQTDSGAKTDPTSNPDPINITISNGLIDVKGEKKLPIINPQQLAIYIDSFIPVTELEFNTNGLDDKTVMKSAVGDTTYNNREIGIGIRPCGFTKDEVKFKMSVAVTLVGKSMDLTVTCLAKGVPDALWGSEKSESTNSNPGTSKVISNVLTGLILQPPPPSHVSQMRTFDFSKLFDESRADFSWEFRQVKVGEAYHATEVLGKYDGTEADGILQKTYSANDVTYSRQRILSLLKEEFDNTLPEIEETEVDKIMASGNNYFKGIPILCGIGEIPQYSTDV